MRIEVKHCLNPCAKKWYTYPGLLKPLEFVQQENIDA